MTRPKLPARALAAAALIASGAALFAAQPMVLAQESGEAKPKASSRVPAAEVLGEGETCIPIAQIRESRVRDDQTIDFIMNGNRVYRNTLPYRCPSLGFERAFSYSTSITQLCSQDIITVLRQGAGFLMPGPSCGLGKFVPVKLIEDSDKQVEEDAPKAASEAPSTP